MLLTKTKKNHIQGLWHETVRNGSEESKISSRQRENGRF